MQKAITNCNIYTEDNIIVNKVIVIEHGVIKAVQNEIPVGAELIDLQGYNIAPGFIDIHINGGEQFYFTQFPTEESIDDIYKSSLNYGTTEVLPCLITSSHENILQGIEAIKNYRIKYNNGVLGMHLEGPFISAAKRGAHLLKFVRKPTNAELEEIIKYGKNIIKVMTIAPECFTDDQLEMLLETDITISAGHSNMTFKQANYYFDKGIKLVTHLYNAMSAFGHREPGLVGATFANEAVYAPIILDGGHCDFAAATIACQLKKDKLILISDALFLGHKKQSFKWGGFEATLVDGLYRNPEGNLAGATISMADAVRNAVLQLNVTLAEAVQMATGRVAKAINMQNTIGKIKADYPARFVKFSDDLQVIEALVL